MLERDFINSVRHIASYYDMHLSPLSYNNFSTLLPIVHSLVVMMWMDDYPDDMYSDVIKSFLKNFNKTGSVVAKNDTKN